MKKIIIGAFLAISSCYGIANAINPLSAGVAMLPTNSLGGVSKSDSSVLKMNGNWKVQVQIPNIYYGTPGKNEFSITGLNYNWDAVSVNNEFKSHNGYLNIGAIKYVDVENYKALTVLTKPINVVSDMKSTELGVWVGSGTISVPEVMTKDKDVIDGLVSNLTYQYKAYLNDQKLYNIDMSMVFEKYNQESFTVKDIGPANIQLQISNLNPERVKGLIDGITDYHSLRSDVNEQEFLIKYAASKESKDKYKKELNTKKANLAAAKNNLLMLFISSFTKESKIQSVATLTTSAGNFNGEINGYVKANPAKPNDLINNAYINITGKVATNLMVSTVAAMEKKKFQREMLLKVNANIDSSKNDTKKESDKGVKWHDVDKKESNHMRKAVETISNWMKEGYIKHQGDYYIINIEIDGGAIKVNGKLLEKLGQ